LEWAETADDFVLAIKGETPPTYTMYELFNPFRVIIDIANASINPSLDLSQDIPKGPVSQITGKVLEDKGPIIARIEFFVDENSSYTIDRQGNDIIVKFAKPASGQPPQNTGPASPQEAQENDVAIGRSAMLTTPSVMEAKPATVLFDIEIEYSATETKVFLKADGAINKYKEVQLEKNTKANRPDRMYLDVKNVKLAGPIQPKKVDTALAQIRTGARTDGFRVVFDSNRDKLFDYTVSVQADGLLVTIKEPSAATAVIAGLLSTDDTEPPISPEPQIIQTITEEIITAETEPTTIMIDSETEEDYTDVATMEQEESSQKETAAAPLPFAGYTKERITVDFYKIDLHNVFRLFGEISNLNMVVDQTVNGSLTLALNDVPWDFALDIILNLKNLQKEERYNTIVISPKSKKFEWPERALETVEFKADASFDFKQQKEEGIRISKLQEIPETVIAAKNLIHQAQNSEKLGNYTAALALYEESFTKWPENTIIAKRIAALSLVRLGQNAKAVHYAKTALKADPNDYDSALQAAIGLARMKKTEQAEEYFEKSISGTEPSSAALSSYAAFNEERNQFDRALDLLKQHESFHGDSLETMISKARIHDKQGLQDIASSEYRTILLSGYEIPADLARYIKGRASLAVQ
jgi:type IV pilus assembly protein PilQ